MLIYYVQSKYGKHIRGIAVPTPLAIKEYKEKLEAALNDKANEVMQVVDNYVYSSSIDNEEVKQAIINAMKWARLR